MSEGHSHGPSLRAGARYQKRMLLSFILVVVFLIVEVIGGVLAGSLTLISDAGHMFTDAIGIGMALAAIQLASRGSENHQRTFGLYRLEILAASANVLLLTGVGLYILYEAVQRLRHEAEVLSGPMLIIATLGLIVNIIAFLLLRSGAEESLNVEGAYLEVLADMLGSIAAIVAALLIGVTGQNWIDAVFAAGIGLFVLPRAFRLGKQTVRILIQSAPPGLDIMQLERDLLAIEHVGAVHDLHAWTLTSDMEVGSAHLVVEDGGDPFDILRAADLLFERYGIRHTTVQLEPSGYERRDLEEEW